MFNLREIQILFQGLTTGSFHDFEGPEFELREALLTKLCRISSHPAMASIIGAVRQDEKSSRAEKIHFYETVRELLASLLVIAQKGIAKRILVVPSDAAVLKAQAEVVMPYVGFLTDRKN